MLLCFTEIFVVNANIRCFWGWFNFSTLHWKTPCNLMWLRSGPQFSARAHSFINESLQRLQIDNKSLLLMWLLTSNDNLCKQFGSRSGPTKRQAWSGSKLFDTDGNPERFFFLKINLKKKSTEDNKSMQNYPACKELIIGKLPEGVYL